MHTGAVRGLYSPDLIQKLQANVTAERAALMVALPDMSDDDLFRCLVALNVIQSFVNDMAVSVRGETVRREVLGSSVFQPAV